MLIRLRFGTSGAGEARLIKYCYHDLEFVLHSSLPNCDGWISPERSGQFHRSDRSFKNDRDLSKVILHLELSDGLEIPVRRLSNGCQFKFWPSNLITRRILVVQRLLTEARYRQTRSFEISCPSELCAQSRGSHVSSSFARLVQLHIQFTILTVLSLSQFYGIRTHILKPENIYRLRSNKLSHFPNGIQRKQTKTEMDSSLCLFYAKHRASYAPPPQRQR